MSTMQPVPEDTSPESLKAVLSSEGINSLDDLVRRASEEIGHQGLEQAQGGGGIVINGHDHHFVVQW